MDDLDNLKARRKFATGAALLGGAALLTRPAPARADTYTSDSTNQFFWKDSTGAGMMRLDRTGLYCYSEGAPGRVQLGNAQFVEAYGATGQDPLGVLNTGQDDASAIQGALDAAGVGGGGSLVYLDPAKKYYVNSAIYVHSGVTLSGHLSRGDFRQTGTNDGFDMLHRGSQIVLGASGSIHLVTSACLQNLQLTYVDLHTTLDPGSSQHFPRTLSNPNGTVNGFSATTAVVLDYAGNMVRDVFIGGFDLAVHAMAGRAVLDGVWGDNHSGILINNSADVSRISNCHFWPWLTAGMNAKRKGFAYKLARVGSPPVDWTRVHNCFCFGYTQGYWLVGADNTQLSMCGADNDLNLKVPLGTAPASFGILVEGAPNNTRIDMCRVAAHDVGVEVRVTSDSSYPGPWATIFLSNTDLLFNTIGFNGTSPNALFTARLVNSLITGHYYGIATWATGAHVYHRATVFHHRMTNSGSADVQNTSITNLGDMLTM